MPNRTDTFGRTTILSYDGTSTSSGGFSMTLPLIGGLSFSGGGYCHASIRLDDDRVTSVYYNGETRSNGAPDAYCAPLVRGCFSRPPQRAAPAPAPSSSDPEQQPTSPDR